MWRGRHADDGQTAAEWLGLLVLVAALVAALVTAGIGGRIGEAVACVVARIAGAGDCARGDVVDDGGPATPCVRSSEVTNVEVGVKVLVATVDGSYGFLIEELSDGTVRVTELVRGEVGGSVGVGGGVAVNAGDQRLGGRAAAGGRAAGYLELGDSWAFPDREQARQHIENTLVDRALDTNPVTRLPVINGVTKGLLGLVGVGGDDVEGERESTRAQVGVLAEGVAEAVGGLASTDVRGGLEEAAGLTRHADGAVDAIFVLTGDAGGSLGIPVLAELDLGVEGSIEVTVSFAPDGGIDTVRLTATGTVTDDRLLGDLPPRAQLGALVGSVVDPRDATRQVVLDYELDVDGPELRAATVDFIASLAPSGTAAGDGAARLGEALVNQSVVTRRVYDLDDGRYGIDASGEFVIGGRLAANLVREHAQLVEAQYHDPASGRFRPWITCTG